jgi:hypothetical protein
MTDILKDKFRLAVFTTFLLMFAGICFFAILNLTGRTHVRFVEVKTANQALETVDQIIKFNFSAPVNKDSTQNFITITPQAEFSTAWSNNTLFLVFKENLSYSTTYKVLISGMKDRYAQSVEDYSYEFTTKKAQLAYIQKSISEEGDSLVISDADFGNKNTVFQSETIQRFAANSQYAAVVTEVKGENDIQIVKLSDKSRLDLGLENTLIQSIEFSPVRNEIAYTAQKIIVEGDSVFPQTEMKVLIYDIDSKITTEFKPLGSSNNILNIKYSRDGMNLLYKTVDSYYFYLPLNDPEAIVQLGRYLGDGGTNFANDKIVFVTFDPLQTFSSSQYLSVFNADRTIQNITDGSIPVFDPMYYYRSDNLVFSQKSRDLEMTPGLYKIVEMSEDGGVKDILTDDDHSLELPKISPDDRYVAIERYSEYDLLSFTDRRNFGFQSKPATAGLVIYDLQEKNLIDTGVLGIEAQWIR